MDAQFGDIVSAMEEAVQASLALSQTPLQRGTSL